MANNVLQKEYFGKFSLLQIKEILNKERPEKIFLVTGKKSYSDCGADAILSPLLKDYQVIHFNDFSPNPELTDMERGLSEFTSDVGLVIAVGGGSVIDAAKLINCLASNKGGLIDYVKGRKKIETKGKPLIAIPTTAGSGSEATRYVVVYVDRVKYSVTSNLIVPDYSIIDPILMLSMPKEVSAASGMDALSQAIEAYWSINSNEVSKAYSKEAIGLILANLKSSIDNPTISSMTVMAKAANISGKAINIAMTTAPHAFAYFITSNYRIPHGHAVGLTLGPILVYNSRIRHEDCSDSRGADYVRAIINEICQMFCRDNPEQVEQELRFLMSNIKLETDFKKLGIGEQQLKNIERNVNKERLLNNPRRFGKGTLEELLKKYL